MSRFILRDLISFSFYIFVYGEPSVFFYIIFFETNWNKSIARKKNTTTSGENHKPRGFKKECPSRAYPSK